MTFRLEAGRARLGAAIIVGQVTSFLVGVFPFVCGRASLEIWTFVVGFVGHAVPTSKQFPQINRGT